MKNVNQIHNATGDNVAGDKIIFDQAKTEEKSIPVWAKWTGLAVSVIGLIWAIYSTYKRI